MLNPSRADAQKNDQTISTCMRVTKQFGFGGMDVVNLFAYCATDPRQLKIARNPVGRRNDEHIRKSINGSKTVLIAWGNGGRLYERSYRVLQLLFQARTNLICLGVTKMGEPRHPLYTRADLGWSSFNCVAE
jgi:hypothetical protein